MDVQPARRIHDRPRGAQPRHSPSPTGRLLIHEETIPARIRSLSDRIKRDGVQSAPIFVDRGTYVVLDGMHRTAIMAELGCRFTCVCLVDYRDPRIKVQRWCRAIKGPFSVGEMDEAIAVGLDLVPSSRRVASTKRPASYWSVKTRRTGWTVEETTCWRRSSGATSWRSCWRRGGTGYAT